MQPDLFSLTFRFYDMNHEFERLPGIDDIINPTPLWTVLGSLIVHDSVNK